MNTENDAQTPPPMDLTQLKPDLQTDPDMRFGTGRASLSTEEEEDPFSGTQTLHIRKGLRLLRWGLFALGSFMFFTYLKLPVEHIKGFLEKTVETELQKVGIQLHARRSDLSVLFGVRYTLEDVEIFVAPVQKHLVLKRVSVAPSLLSLLVGKTKATVEVTTLSGALDASVGFSGKSFSIDAQLNKLDPFQSGLFNAALPFEIRGSGKLSGNLELSGNPNDARTWEGNSILNLVDLKLEPQTIASTLAIKIPEVKISEGRARVTLHQGKANFDEIAIGKPNDDLIVNSPTPGTLTFMRDLMSSEINLGIRLTLSPKVMKDFILLDALFAAGKQAEGTYGLRFSGPLANVSATPSTDVR